MPFIRVFQRELEIGDRLSFLWCQLFSIEHFFVHNDGE